MKRKQQSLITNLGRLSIIPLFCLGICVLIISVFSIYTALKAESRDGLHNLAYSLIEICQLEGSGDYAQIDGILTKGGIPFNSDFSIVDNVKAVSGVDATIFYNDTRMLTSIRNPNGSRSLHTHAVEKVADEVLKQGNDYFSGNVQVNGIPYFGYYTPLKNSDHTIVGMVFVGKAREQVIHEITKITSIIFIVVAFIILVTSTISILYSKRIIYSLHKTKEFLGSIVYGNVENTMDPQILARHDEIGEMGRFAVMLQKSIIELVGTDPLTGLNNRRSCEIILSNTIQEFKKCQTPYALAIGDIDNFKYINDTYGHQAGDKVLKELSIILIEHMRHKGFVSRWGGEEFLFIYERIKKEQALSYLEDLSSIVRTTPFFYKNLTISVTMTFGAAEYEKGTDMEAILKRADDNLYCGKSHGKNQIIF